MGQAADIMGEENKMVVARTHGLRLIQQLIPYLELREVRARQYFDYQNDSEEREKLGKEIGAINKNIKEILGL